MGMRVGIIGDGQQAQLLAREAGRLGLETRILPASTSQHGTGTAFVSPGAEPDDAIAVESLARRVDVITFATDRVPAATLRQLARLHTSGTVKIAPQPELLRCLVSKTTQQEWIRRSGLPASPLRDSQSNCWQESSTGKSGHHLLSEHYLSVPVIHGLDGSLFNLPAVAWYGADASTAANGSALPSDGTLKRAEAISRMAVRRLGCNGFVAVQLTVTRESTIHVTELMSLSTWASLATRARHADARGYPVSPHALHLAAITKRIGTAQSCVGEKVVQRMG